MSTNLSPTDNVTEISVAEAAEQMFDHTEEGDSVMMWGKPGIGKSDVVNQMGVRTGRKVIEFHAALREPVDLRGIPQADGPYTRWLVPSELPQVERDGEKGYLFCDEINQASPQMMSALAGLILYGVVGDYHLPPGWRVIAAGNRVTDRAAAQRMPSHMRNRFAHLYVRPDVNAWATWATANGVAPEMVAFIRLRRELIHRMPRGDENAFPTPRSLTKAAKYVRYPDEKRMRRVASLVGDDVAAELEGFLRLYRSVCTLEDIVRDPDGAKVPTQNNASERYAVATGLARLADRKNFANIAKYAKRLGGEHEMLLMHDAALVTPSLKETAVYSKWAVANSGTLMQV